MNIRQNMKKRFIALLIGLSLGVSPVMAQVFIMDEEEYGVSGREGTRDLPGGFIPHPGGHGTGQDWYTPVGDGFLLLAGMGVAYLFGKSRKRKDEE